MAFMSGSSVESFSKNLSSSMLKKKALAIPAACIGPQTAKAAKKVGFKKIIISKVQTAKGLAHTIKKAIYEMP